MKHLINNTSILQYTRLVAIFALCIFLSLTLSGCRKKRGQNADYELGIGTAPMNVWVGYFRFDEYGGGDVGEENPTAIFVGHVLTVRQVGDSLRANLSANGVQHSSELICTVKESKEAADTLHVFFQRYGANHDSTKGTYRPGAHLLSLVRTQYITTTFWYDYKPVYLAKKQGSVCFMKENEDDVPNMDIDDFGVYWAEYTKTLAAQDSVKIAYMTAFPLVGSNYVRPEGALTDIVSKTDFMANYQIVMFPALRKVLQSKKTSDFQAGIKNKDQSIFLPNGLVPIGAQLYRLTVTSKELQNFTAIPSEQLSASQQKTEDTKELSKEQTSVLRRNNKIAKELQAEYKWAVFVARLQGHYRVCYVGIAPEEEKL